MQLVAYGAQDIYLTGNPMITYFKVVYRRHTNFAIESIEQTFNGVADFGQRVSCLISRNGDLINNIYVEATLPIVSIVQQNAGQNDQALGWIKNVGHYVIQDVDLEIGGQQIDRQYADWLEIWAQLSVPAGQKTGYYEMIGQQGTVSPVSPQRTTEIEHKIFVPLQFWFCRNIGLSLPLISLQYHEVKINVTFNPLSTLITSYDLTNAYTSASTIPSYTAARRLNASLWIDYIYLDTDERWRFAQASHEYLMEQLQFTGDLSIDAGMQQKNIDLDFNHPVKELIWVCRYKTFEASNQWNNYTTAPLESVIYGENPMVSGKLMLNGQDRFSTRDGKYFNLVQPRQAHTNIPESCGINVYSFAIKPEAHQPSGSCNFSRIDNAVFAMRFRDTNTKAASITADYTDKGLAFFSAYNGNFTTGPDTLTPVLFNLAYFNSLTAAVNAAAGGGLGSPNPPYTLADAAALNTWIVAATVILTSHPTLTALNTYVTTVLIFSLLVESIVQTTAYSTSASFTLALNILSQLAQPAYITPVMNDLVTIYANIRDGRLDLPIDNVVSILNNVLINIDYTLAGIISPTVASMQELMNDAVSYVHTIGDYLSLTDYSTYKGNSFWLQTNGLYSSARTFKIFATNYNVLRIMSGMAGLAYSN